MLAITDYLYDTSSHSPWSHSFTKPKETIQRQQAMWRKGPSSDVDKFSPYVNKDLEDQHETIIDQKSNDE